MTAMPGPAHHGGLAAAGVHAQCGVHPLLRTGIAGGQAQAQ